MIRTATPADHEAIVRFNLALARESEDRELDEGTLRRGVAAFLEDPARGRYYLAFEDPEEGRGGGPEPDAGPGTDGIGSLADEPSPIGQVMVTYEYSDWRAGPIWWIQSVYVHSDHRRAGVYRALHAHLAREARRAGAVGLRLYVDRANRRAKDTYEAMGMKPSRYDMYEDLWS